MWTRFVREHPPNHQHSKRLGGEACELDDEVLQEWRVTLEKLLKAKDFEEVALRPSGRFKSPLNARLWEAWRKASGDPERDLVSWIRFGTPLGMSPSCTAGYSP